MSSSLLLQQCLACLVCLTLTVVLMGCRWPYSCCFVGCCLWDLFNINMRLVKAWTAVDWLSVIWISDLTNKIKHSFLQTVVESIVLYRCTTWTLTKCMEKKLHDNYRRMLQAVLNKSWRQYPTKQQRYGHYLFIIFTNSFAQVGNDTRSIFKRSLTGLNSEFSFS